VFAGCGYAAGSFPVAEAAAGRVISLPMHPYLTDEQQRSVVDAVHAALSS
jgi:dTDP-4-amino-4,6-dideoxygalactose transaminase